jgi:hypothetical protein
MPGSNNDLTDWEAWSDYLNSALKEKDVWEARTLNYKPPMPLLSPLVHIPPKTIKTPPEFLPPYTTIDINSYDEAIDLDELRKYGRYANIVKAHDNTKQFVISNEIVPGKEVPNPEYARAMIINAEIERKNKQDVEKHEKALAAYNKTQESMPSEDPVAGDVLRRHLVRQHARNHVITKSVWQALYGPGVGVPSSKPQNMREQLADEEE